MYAIMIVEDEELIRQGLTSLVDYEQFGMTVINQAENGREAWKKFQDQPADILLTDINMPQMNGLDLAHLVKEQSPSCHIIFLTGYDDFEFARKAIKLGADDYLLKPFSKDDIEEMLAKVKGKLDQERKKAQVSFSRFPVNPERFGLSTWFQSLLSKCIDQEKIGTPLPRLSHSRANEEGSTLASHDRSKDL